MEKKSRILFLLLMLVPNISFQFYQNINSTLLNCPNSSQASQLGISCYMTMLQHCSVPFPTLWILVFRTCSMLLLVFLYHKHSTTNWDETCYTSIQV